MFQNWGHSSKNVDSVGEYGVHSHIMLFGTVSEADLSTNDLLLNGGSYTPIWIGNLILYRVLPSQLDVFHQVVFEGSVNRDTCVVFAVRSN
jgi:hypothetical protein